MNNLPLNDIPNNPSLNKASTVGNPPYRPFPVIPQKNLNTYQNGSSQQGTHIHNIGAESLIIKDVWAENFEEEFRHIMVLAEKYKTLGMVYHFQYNIISFIYLFIGYRVSRNCI